MEYVKINSLYKRESCGPYDEEKKRYVCDLQKKRRHSPIIEGEYACPEFEAIDSWTVTEKIDGTNIRIIFDRKNEGTVDIRGRTDNAQIPPHLLKVLQEMFKWETLSEVFKESSYAVLFGEGYGPKIQSGGYYRKEPGFILFDVFVSGWWLMHADLEEVAKYLGIEWLPLLHTSSHKYIWTKEDIVRFVKGKYDSNLALLRTGEQHEMEGVVARSYPQMLFRKGGPIMFKLKCRDFE